MDVSGLVVELSGVSLNATDYEELPTKEHVLKDTNDFGINFYRFHDRMRLEFAELINGKFVMEREEKPKEKELLSKLLTLRCDDFNEKVKTFYSELDEFLQKIKQYLR
jgi:hypothetical protein